MDSPMLQKLPNSEIFCGAHTLPSYILLNYFSMCRLFLTFVHLFIRMVLESEHSGCWLLLVCPVAEYKLIPSTTDFP